jgi:hypothetical protein
MTAPHWTAYIAALLVPLVAILAALLAGFIAYRQWRVAQNKLKLDLFDRRFNVFTAATKLIRCVTTTGGITDAELQEFVSGIAGAKWLLSSEVDTYLSKQLYDKAIDLQCLQSEIKAIPRGESRAADNLAKQAELKKFIIKQRNVLEEKFSPFMQIQH